MSNGQHLPRKMLELVNVWLLFVTNKASGNYLLHHECEILYGCYVVIVRFLNVNFIFMLFTPSYTHSRTS